MPTSSVTAARLTCSLLCLQPLAVSKGNGADVVQRIMDAVHKRKIVLSEGLGASQQVMVR